MMFARYIRFHLHQLSCVLLPEHRSASVEQYFVQNASHTISLSKTSAIHDEKLNTVPLEERVSGKSRLVSTCDVRNTAAQPIQEADALVFCTLNRKSVSKRSACRPQIARCVDTLKQTSIIGRIVSTDAVCRTTHSFGVTPRACISRQLWPSTKLIEVSVIINAHYVLIKVPLIEHLVPPTEIFLDDCPRQCVLLSSAFVSTVTNEQPKSIFSQNYNIVN